MWTGGGWTSSWACTCLFCMPSSSASPSWSNTTSSRLSTCPCATRICRPEDFHGFEPKYLQDRPKSPMILLFPLFNLFTELLLLKKTTVSHFTFKPLWFRWKNCISQNTIDSLSLHQFQEIKFSLAALFITVNSSTSEPWTIAMQPVIVFTELTIVFYRIQTVHFHHKLHTRQWQRMLLIPVCISNLRFLISVFPWDTLTWT